MSQVACFVSRHGLDFTNISLLTCVFSSDYHSLDFINTSYVFWLTCELLQSRVVRRPSLSSSSVSRARFVTAGAIDLKTLYIWTPRWNDCTDKISVRSDSWLVHQGAKTENAKSAVTPELMTGSSPNFYHRYMYI
jgi:hypothetical protein